MENVIGALLSDFPFGVNRRWPAVSSGMVDCRPRARRRRTKQAARFSEEVQGTMRGSRWLAIGALALIAGISCGCHSSGTKPAVVTKEPGLTDATEVDTKVADGTIQA